MKQLLYQLPDDFDTLANSSSVVGTFTLLPQASHQSHYAYYDSFDWRLYRKALALVGNKRSIHLTDLNTAEDGPPVAISKRPLTRRPSFAWDLPDSSVKEQVAPLLDVRALLPQAEVYTQSTPYRILNEDEKTVARLIVETIRPSAPDAPPLADCVHLLPLHAPDFV